MHKNIIFMSVWYIRNKLQNKTKINKYNIWKKKLTFINTTPIMHIYFKGFAQFELMYDK